MNLHALRNLFVCLVLLWSSTALWALSPVSSLSPPEGALGRAIDFYQETGGQLTLDQAGAAQARGEFTPGDRTVLDFGIDAAPVWLHFRVENATPQAMLRRMTVENAWLDRIDIYIRHGGRVEGSSHLGDRKPFTARPVANRFFVLDHAFAPGVSDVFVRIETPDPMAVPIYLATPEEAMAREGNQHYFYGLLYGFIFALLAYNAMLYAGLRKRQYLLYSIYLGAFMLMNMSYTGHGFAWFWPEATRWTQWANPLFMVLFGSSGLLFAQSFLNTRAKLPRAHRVITAFLGATVVLELLAVILGSQVFALLVAFVFAFMFAFVMLGLGIAAVRLGEQSAKYFLLAAVFTLMGASITTPAVWGLIPYNALTFHAVEIGMALDATLLALALAYQFRLGQREKLRAEELATLDPLTGISNRRAFYAKATALWSVSQRNNRDLSVILLDIDRFKQLNDTHGHAAGDEALVEIAKALTKAIREQDVAARWGGEEFIVLLPETTLREAATLAERLRAAIATIHLPHAGGGIAMTASLGVAQRDKFHTTLDVLISSADGFLYQAKEAGRDRVAYPVAESAPAR